MTIEDDVVYHEYSSKDPTTGHYGIAKEPIGTINQTKSKMSLSDVMSEFHGSTHKIKTISTFNSQLDNRSVFIGDTVCLDKHVISLKRGSVTLSFQIVASVVVTANEIRESDYTWKSNNVKGGRLSQTTISSVRAAADYCHVMGGLMPFWEVTGTITARSRQKSGGHKIIGTASNGRDLSKLIGEAEDKVSWLPELPDFLEFMGDDVVMAPAERCAYASFPVYPSRGHGCNKKQINVVSQAKGFRYVGVFGIVSVLEDLQIVAISGGNRKPYFLCGGEVESGAGGGGGYTGRRVVINADASGYLFTRVANGVAYVTEKQPKEMNALSVIDKALIKRAIEEYVRNM